MKIDASVEYINYIREVHQTFPRLLSCKIYSKNGIINMELNGSYIFNEIIDDIGYDNKGKFISITIGQWHHIETGNYISNEEFYDLSEKETYDYDYVSILIKIYIKDDYRACYHNDYDRKVKISFIPYNMIDFSENTSKGSSFLYKDM